MVTGNFTIRYLDGITSTGTRHEEYEPEGDGFGIRVVEEDRSRSY